MGLLGNYNVLSKNIGRRMGGTTESGDRYNFGKSGAARNRFQVFARFNALPSGYEPPYAWVLAQIGGGMATFTLITAQLSTTQANMANGVNLTASVNAQLSTTQADMELVVALAASLSAALSTTNANLLGTLQLIASLTAQLSTTQANMGAVVGMAAALSALITTSANMTGLAHLSADILPFTELSPESLARAVWNQDITTFVAASTAGKKLNDVSVGGSAWDALIEGGHDAAAVLRILLAHATGEATLPTSGVGDYEFLSVDGTKTRIAGAVDALGNRTIDDIDGTE